MAYIDKSAQWSITKEDSYGDKKAPTLPADLVEVINPSLTQTTDMIDREVLTNSMVKAKPLRGKETSSGSLEIELSTVASGVLNGDLLYQSAFGHKIAPVAATSGSASTSGSESVITFDIASDADNYEVGQAIKATGGATAEYAVVRSISAGTSITVSPAISTSQTSFGGLLSYTIARPDADQISLAIQEYIEGSSRVEYTTGGLVVTDMTITFPIANVAKASFNLAGAGFSVKEDGVNGATVANRAPACLSFTPYVSKNMTFKYAGQNYDIENLEVKVASDIYDTEALTTDGLTNKTATGKSEVGGTFGLEYLGTTLFSKFKSGTTGELFGTISNANSTALVYAPKVVLTESTKTPDNGVYKETVKYACLSSNCADTSEDAITVAFE